MKQKTAKKNDQNKKPEIVDEYKVAPKKAYDKKDQKGKR